MGFALTKTYCFCMWSSFLSFLLGIISELTKQFGIAFSFSFHALVGLALKILDNSVIFYYYENFYVKLTVFHLNWGAEFSSYQ